MIDADRMVGTLTETVQDADAASCLGSGREHGIGKSDLVDDLRAAECEYEPAWSDLGDRGGIRFGKAHAGRLGGRRDEDAFDAFFGSGRQDVLEGHRESA